MGGGAGRTVLQDTDALYQAGVFESRRSRSPRTPTFAEQAELVADEFEDEGWVPLDEVDAGFGQAGSAAGVFLEETGAFAAGEFQAVNVFDIGGERYPKISDSLDFLAFCHEPHYAVVEVAPLEPTRTEPGRAPAPPRSTRPASTSTCTWSATSAPAASRRSVLTIGAGLIFLALCWLLHRRERVVTDEPQHGPGPGE